jgi:hypothetical protein
MNDTKKRVCFLAIPNHSGIRHETIKAALVLAPSNRTDVFEYDLASGCLAYNFNCCWSQWINQPGKFDYFCMLHADVQPTVQTGSWLDVLLDELDSGYDVMHAVTAIKDEKGHTSTAIGDADVQHQWVRKITTKEMQGLPDTFEAQDALTAFGGHCGNPCLLPNTGCMALRWDMRWRTFPGFSQVDRLAIRTEDGRHILAEFDEKNRVDCLLPDDIPGDIVPLTVPEDWNFGLWCARHGVRVGGTKKVATNHWGVGCWQSATAWGQERDESYFQLKGCI